MLAGLGKVHWTDENLALRFLKDPDIAEIRVGSFSVNNFPEWIQNTFETLREKKTKVLILDLRGNHGGRDKFGAMLVSDLTDKPFRYFDHINIRTITLGSNVAGYFNWPDDQRLALREGVAVDPEGGYLATARLNPGVGEQLPNHPFLGRVFILINGGTFSAAADFCAIIRHLKRATFIGEETGGAYYGNNSGMMPILTLPNSGLRIPVPMYEYWNAVMGDGGSGRGTRPDYSVETTAANVMRGLDEQLDVALRLADSNR